MMTRTALPTTDWPAIKSLFSEALDLPASQRTSFVLERSSDPGVIHEVHRLLQLELQAGDFLSAPVEPSAVSRPLSPVLEPGRVLCGRYRIDQLIGLGGMCGGVYEAYDLDLEVPLAIKAMTGKQEFLTARAVTHPNVCRVFDCAVDGELRFLTMELLDGETLAARLQRKGPLAEGEWADFAAQLCSGLAAAHRAGILHRDLKPSNIFLTRGGRVVIGDFGLASAAPGASATSNRETSRHLTGTLPYMAPELLAGRPASIRSDVYSLGVVLHEAATGRLQVDPVKLPAKLKRILTCCLQMDPALRPQSAESVAISARSNPFLLRGIVRIWPQQRPPACSTNARPAKPRLGRSFTPDSTHLSGLPW